MLILILMRRPYQSSWKLLLAVLAGAALGGSGAWWIFPAQAEAATCGAVKYDTEATDNASYTHHGVNVTNPGMYIYNYDTACTHISSIAVIYDSDDLVEIGWSDDGDQSEVCEQGSASNIPYLFWVLVYHGSYACYRSINLASAQSDGFGVADEDGDWTFSYTHDGSVVIQLHAAFSRGTVITNAERHDTAGSARALFDGLRYMILNGGWTAWTQAHCYTGGSNDPDWNNQLLSAIKVQVTTQSPQC